MIVTVIQARMTSTRFPGKVMKPLLGAPMILRQVERARNSALSRLLVIATSVEPSDDPLAELCRAEGLSCHRGSLEDVLGRFHGAASAHGATHAVRLTGDCPLTDPEVIDRVIRAHLDGGFDYTSNTQERTFPDGLDVEVCRIEALARAVVEARLPSEREHVTPYLYRHPETFRLGQVKDREDHSNLRLTVDEPDDLALVEKIYQALYPAKHLFPLGDIIALLDAHPDWKLINSGHTRNEGFLRSIEKDREYLEGENRTCR